MTDLIKRLDCSIKIIEKFTEILTSKGVKHFKNIEIDIIHKEMDIKELGEKNEA